MDEKQTKKKPDACHPVYTAFYALVGGMGGTSAILTSTRVGTLAEEFFLAFVGIALLILAAIATGFTIATLSRSQKEGSH